MLVFLMVKKKNPPRDTSIFQPLNLTKRSSLLSTTRDTTLNGFFIPKERCVFVNQWQVTHDP